MESALSKKKIWQEHIEKASRHSGGVSGYCREAKINASGFYQWRKKLLGKRKAHRLVDSFVPVVPTVPTCDRLDFSKSVLRTDAEWVGQMLASFVRGLS